MPRRSEVTKVLPASRAKPPKPSGRDWKAMFWRALPLALAVFGIALGFFVPYLWVLDARVQEEFGRLTWQVPTRVYARSLTLAPNLPMNAATLEEELSAARYVTDAEPRQAGTYARDGGRFVIATRGLIDLDGRTPPQRIEVTVGDGRVRSLSVDGKTASIARLDPARIATLYGEKQEERRLVRLQDAPPILLATLQAVEDRDFKHHIGIDISGMIRAAWVNLREADAKQGASTLTQQLVRNLYLTRDKSFARKAREILYALIIEARFDKSTILEAYLNQAYLGQQGGQAVHGVAAGAEFWFGRDLDQLGTSDIALLVGLIKGPSEYDPRKHPERALQRRNVVLRQMADTGIITEADLELARERPLGVTARASLSRDRYPAFMDLVRDQLQRDYPADALRGAGLSVLTTLAPSVQGRSEIAVTTQLDALTKEKRPPLQAGLVVTDTATGQVLAVVGGRDVAAHGFNRALEARRPVGSLLKPFVFLLALAQPDRYSLAVGVEDAPITLKVAGGKTWSPENSDNTSHGWVTLTDALAHSYNQATVRIGMDIGVDRLVRLIKVLAEIEAAPNPSLLLGAVDLSPLQMAQAYQFLASGGQVQPLRAVRGVLDAQGQALNRYDAALEPAQAGDAIAARLVSLALQETVRSGTARALLTDGRGPLASAGKTGTSNDSRDSWYAGYTGSHLAVIWVGNDDNEPTGLYGGTGAMRVWSKLFDTLPSAPLRVSEDGLEAAWVDVEKYAVTDEDCPQARRFLFVHGYTPEHYERCPMSRLRGWFGREGD